MFDVRQQENIKSPAANGALGLLHRYWVIPVVFVVIGLNFFIRNTDLSFYKYGLALAWLIWSLVIFKDASRLVSVAGLLFSSMMVYTQLDNIFWTHNRYDTNDTYLICCFSSAVAVHGIIDYFIEPYNISRKDLINVALLCVMIFLMIAGRNPYDHYFEFYRWLGWGPEVAHRIFFRCDALAGVLSTAYFVYNTSGLNRRTGIFHMLYCVNNYFTETVYDPLHPSFSTWAMIVIITIFGLWLLVSYVSKAISIYREREAHRQELS